MSAASVSKKSLLLLDSTLGLMQRKTLVPNEGKDRVHLTGEDESDVNPILLREYASLSNPDEAQVSSTQLILIEFIDLRERKYLS